MNPQGWKPLSGRPPIPRGANVYIMQAPTETTIKN